MADKKVALSNEVIRGLVGSTAHGINIEGQDDRDEMGVFIEPALNVCGLKSVDHYIYRTQPEGVRSGPGDLDLTLYSLRKFVRLATQGNPSVLVLLWLPNYITITDEGERLVKLREAFLSKDAGARFLGYLVSQRMRLTGEKSKNVARPELVEKHGYDTKFAMHALRLGLEGIEYLTDGCLTLPVPEPRLSTLRAVRAGDLPFEDVLKMIEGTEARLRLLVDMCHWEPNYDKINGYLVSAHERHWSHPSPVLERN